MSSRVGQVPSCPRFRSHLSGYVDISAGPLLGSSPSPEQWGLVLFSAGKFSGSRFGDPCGALLLKAIQNHTSYCVSYQNLGLQFSVQHGFLSGKPWTVTLVTDRHLKVVAHVVVGGQEEHPPCKKPCFIYYDCPQ